MSRADRAGDPVTQTDLVTVADPLTPNDPVTVADLVTPTELPVLFVCGLHRSGTSALARLLSSSPLVRGMTGTGVPEDEGQHLQRLLPTAAAHGGPGLFAFDPGSHLTERSPLANRSVASGLLSAWLPYWRLAPGETTGWADDRALVVLEKSPPNVVRSRLLQALFPNARFVALLRHPAVVTVSTSRWRPALAPATLLRHWVTAHRRLRSDAARLGHLSVLRYEELTDRPDVALAGLARDLGIRGPFDTDLLRAGLDERHLEAWRAVSDGISGAERRGLERSVQEFGYSLDPPYVRPRGSVWA